MKLTNYLFFTTNCEDALKFYTKCGFGAVASMVRHGENGMPLRTESMRGKIMHAHFTGPNVDFYASDNDDAEPMRGFAMIFMLDDRGQTEVLFHKLAEGGQITTPLGVQPWGDYYGKLTDKFGVQWMLNCTSKT
ncbi:glyoxalase/bleomycin resistance/extradiol dioxygenase family protein [Pendulispora brunnea]|uniref:Glyoxalase/bleomycin resistance/extradiol dioxygenase family protein n=1 Tax=Pendulispora brunnea TaxID=2905690 RepID=A0ABZ2KET1_9BACT